MTPDDGKGPLIPDCKNVADGARTERYITEFYMTTWGSAMVEGASQGLSAAMTDAGVTAHPPDGVNKLGWQPDPFCRHYEVDARTISNIVAEILPQVGNPVLVSDPGTGIFRTGYIERAHATAKWRDRYVITVTPHRRGGSVVRILRTVLISRDGMIFNQGISVGHNENWIMTQIADRLQ